MSYNISKSSIDFDAMTVGESTIPRRIVSYNSVAVTNGSMRLTYFTARKSETVTTIRTVTGTTAAVGSTLSRVGIYTVASNGDLTLVASIPDTKTTLWIGISTVYTTTLSASFAKKQGQRYAVGYLVTGCSTTPAFAGISALATAEIVVAPRLAGLVTGLTDIPSSVAAASIADGATSIYTALVP